MKQLHKTVVGFGIGSCLAIITLGCGSKLEPGIPRNPVAAPTQEDVERNTDSGRANVEQLRSTGGRPTERGR